MPPKTVPSSSWFRDIEPLENLTELKFKRWKQAIEDAACVLAIEQVPPETFVAVIISKTRSTAREHIKSLSDDDRKDPGVIFRRLEELSCPNLSMERARVFDEISDFRQHPDELLKDYIGRADSLQARAQEHGADVQAEHWGHLLVNGIREDKAHVRDAIRLVADYSTFARARASILQMAVHEKVPVVSANAHSEPPIIGATPGGKSIPPTPCKHCGGKHWNSDCLRLGAAKSQVRKPPAQFPCSSSPN